MESKSKVERIESLGQDLESFSGPSTSSPSKQEFESKVEMARSLGDGVGIKADVLPVFEEPPEPAVEFDDRKIYLMECNEYTKIGISSNPEERLVALQAGNPLEITLRSTIKSDVAKRTEEALHRKLDQYRTEGGEEWFDLPDDVWVFLEERDVLLVSDAQSLPSPEWRSWD